MAVARILGHEIGSGTVRGHEERHRQPKHRGDAEEPANIEWQDAIVTLLPRQHEGERADHEEQLDAARALLGDETQRLLQVRHSD